MYVKPLINAVARIIVAPPTPSAESCNSYDIFEPPSTPLDSISIKSSASSYFYDRDTTGESFLKLDYSSDTNGPWEKQNPNPPNPNPEKDTNGRTNEQLQHDLLQQLQQQFQLAAVQQQQQRQLLQHQHSHPPFQAPQQHQPAQQQHPSAQLQHLHHSHHPPLQHHLSLGGYQQLQLQSNRNQYSTPQHHYRNATPNATGTSANAATIRRRTLSHVSRSYSLGTSAAAAAAAAATTATPTPATSSASSNNQLSIHKTGIMVAASRCRSPIMLCHSHSDGEFPLYR
ncbi:hormone receptor 4-like, partial [Drosophila rhopaloa]|uniref:Uncharacterized protein n=1 Tax=Drosophila rhopaloa TaxID=1041015 RepID=A0ABM5J107_DRORH